jgi:hypothetical protein
MFRPIRLTLLIVAFAGLLPAAAMAQDVNVAAQPPADAPDAEPPPPPASTTATVVTDDSPYWYQGSDGVAYWYNPQVTTWAYSRVERRWVSAAVARRVLIGPVGLRPVVVARPAVVRPVVRAAVVQPVVVQRTVVRPVAVRPAVLPRRR